MTFMGRQISATQLMRMLILGLALFVVVSRDGACEGPGGPPNILLILSDDQRPDTIAALGNPIISTPHLDALARRGLVYHRAVSPNPICTPARAEILTGCSSFENGVLDFGGAFPPEMRLWPQTMKASGYQTWYVGKWHNHGRPTDHGFQATRGLFASGGGKWWEEQVDWKGTPVTGYRGWVFQNDQGQKFPARGVGLTRNISSQFADAAIAIIEDSGTQPFFLQVNFTAPHDPLWYPTGFEDLYDPQEIPVPKNFLPKHPFDHGNLRGRDEKLLPWPRTPEMVQENLAVYYSVISHMDQQIGRILAALKASGQIDSTVIIFSSDHGLAIGSHGLRGKQNMYEHTVGVPLIIAGPGIVSGQQCQQPVYLRDLYPTICDLAGIPIPETVSSRSFVNTLTDPASSTHESVFCYFRNQQRMVRDSRWKLVHYPELGHWQLFDLEEDPHELTNQADTPNHANTFRRMKQLLKTEQARFGDPLLQKP